MHAQLQRLHLSGLRGRVCDTTIRLAERLARLSPDPESACWFVTSGSEAVECSIKIAKAYHRAAGRKPHAFKVISRWGAYHGVVGSALAATGTLLARSPYEPGVPGVSRVPAPWAYRWPLQVDYETWSRLCVEYLEQHILEEDPSLVAAFIAEPVMQYSGAQPPPPDYFARVREVCSKHDVLFIADEVITGFGRTGEWFGLNRWQVKPDLICTAKGVTAGYAPLAAVIASREVWDAVPALYGGHTHAGSPAGAAAALAVCDVYERDGIIERSRSVGAEVLERLRALEELEAVGQVRGQGMWVAVDFTSDKSVQALPDPDLVNRVAQRAQELGVIVTAIGTSVEIAPSLNITPDDLDTGLSRFEAAVREVTR
jgi:adenosylmethionine-8-amino-7-oxononanoate aminotransferase